MIVTVDRLGRIVIPKPLRVALGIGPNTELELMPDGAGLRLEPTTRSERPIEQQDGLPLLGRVEGAELTDDDVRRLRDELQR
jgi:AbrB family looped-hinge helix DNA binding protein